MGNPPKRFPFSSLALPVGAVILLVLALRVYPYPQVGVGGVVVALPILTTIFGLIVQAIRGPIQEEYHKNFGCRWVLSFIITLLVIFCMIGAITGFGRLAEAEMFLAGNIILLGYQFVFA